MVYQRCFTAVVEAYHQDTDLQEVVRGGGEERERGGVRDEEDGGGVDGKVEKV